MGDLRQADFGVAHGRSAVAIDRAEVALTVDQHMAQGKRLRHAHDRVVNGSVTVWMVFTHHIAHDARALLEWPVPVVVLFVHPEQDATVYGFEAVAGVRQGAAHDYAHRVIEVAAAHLLFEADGQRFLGKFGHA